MNELPDIRTGISKPDLFQSFKVQFKKDLELCGIDSDFVDGFTPDYEFIHSRISQEVERISKGSKLMELLYRIDISEKQINKKVKEDQEKSFYDVISELIIKRELQKVVIRQFYKNNE